MSSNAQTLGQSTKIVASETNILRTVAPRQFEFRILKILHFRAEPRGYIE
jgi:hypothetical protein